MTMQDAILKRIEQLKLSNNLTQYAMCERAGIPQATVISFKRKRSRDIGVTNLYRICTGLGVSIIEFFDSPLFNNIEID